MSIDNNERLVRLEKDMESLTKTTQKIETRVDAMYDAFVQAKGAKWVIISLWMGVGAALVNVKALLTFIGVKFS